MKLRTSIFLLCLGAGLLLMAVQDPLMGLGLMAWTAGVDQLGKRWDTDKWRRADEFMRYSASKLSVANNRRIER
jgi:hypothetical protein